MVAALAPALLAFLFASWCGTFGNWSGGLAGGATGVAAAGGQLLVILAGAYGAAGGGRKGAAWWDPWRLGRSGRLLLPALAAAVALAWATSPVPRAGRVGLVLLPAFLWLPVAVSGWWRDGRRRRLGLRGVSLAVVVVASWALAEWAAGRTPRAADPLGHHLLLSAWLALLLPVALLPWRDGGWGRGLAGAAGLAGVAALIAARSLAGALALAIEVAVAGLVLLHRGLRSGAGRPARRRWRLAALAVLALLAAAPLVPRALRVLGGADPSARARWVYWRAGVAGVAARPVTGLGPGATAWTLAAYLRPVPGVNPPGEAVGELHLLPLEIAYELGLPGLALAAAAAALFGGRRWRERPAAVDPGLLVAGLAGLAGGAAVGLATADWRVTALPVAAAVAAGAALAGGRDRDEAEGEPEARWRRPVGAPAAVAYAVAAVLLLAPLDLAQHAYDVASVSAPREALARLDRAVALDPAFPLYRARRAWLQGDEAPPGGSRKALADAVRAAEQASGVAVLWLRAGGLAEEGAAGPADRALASVAFERACALQPLGPFAPFALVRVGAPLGDPAALTARALASEPRLAAATLWQARPELLERGLEILGATPGIEAGWRQAVVARVRSGRTAEGAAGEVGELATVLDAHAAGSVSLYLFRRLPWRAELLRVPVRRAAAVALGTLPAATELPGTDPRLFPPVCTGPFDPQPLRKTLRKTR